MSIHETIGPSISPSISSESIYYWIIIGGLWCIRPPPSHSSTALHFANDTPNHSIRHWPVTRATWLSGNQIRNRETRRRLVMGDSTRTRSDFKCLGAQGAPPLVQLDLFHFIGGVHSRSNLQYTCIHARSYLCTNTDLPSSFAAVQITFHAQCHRKASRRE